MPQLVKTTHTYATHEIPLECDIYEAPGYPKDSPVFLFFHYGGLVSGSRLCVPPWLVQTCLRNQWPLIAASYRLVFHVDGKGVLDDVADAYEFSQNYGGEAQRKVIVGGKSIGGWLATMAAHHLQPPPLALMTISGGTTVHHPFFNSSTLLLQEDGLPTAEAEVERRKWPVSVGWTGTENEDIFQMEKLLPSGKKNPSYVHPQHIEGTGPYPPGFYAYYVHENAFPKLIGGVDPGFEWAMENHDSEKAKQWPMTILLHGRNEVDIPASVSQYVASCLRERAKLCLCDAHDHLFEASSFLEDTGGDMDVVRQAVWELELAVKAALAQTTS